MTRKLKILGLALVGAVALSTAAAPTASADTFSAATSPAFLTGAQGALAWDEFEFTDLITHCEANKYDGTMAGPVTSIKLTPTFSKCKLFGSESVVDVNGCVYNFTISDTIKSETTGTVNIECSAGQEITFTIPFPKCVIHIEPQAIPVTYSNVAGGKIKFSINYNGTRYSETTTAEGGCAASNPVTQTGGAYRAEGTITGFSDAGHTKATALALIK